MTLVEFAHLDPAMQLACDELLLEQAEAGERGETIRFYEIEGPVIVLGVGGVWEREIHRRDEVPVLRRASGGGTVVLAKGCLNYALVLDTARERALTGVNESYAWILSRVAAALGKRGVDAAHEGLSDLAAGGRKIGGSAQRRKRRYILHHGTLLYDFDPSLLPRLLKEPPEAPAYRAGRTHGEFVTNVPLSPGKLRDAVIGAFDTGGDPAGIEESDVETLAEDRYRTEAWTFRR